MIPPCPSSASSFSRFLASSAAWVSIETKDTRRNMMLESTRSKLSSKNQSIVPASSIVADLSREWCVEVDFSTHLDVQISEIAILFRLHRHRQQSCKTHLWGLLKAHLETSNFSHQALLAFFAASRASDASFFFCSNSSNCARQRHRWCWYETGCGRSNIST